MMCTILYRKRMNDDESRRCCWRRKIGVAKGAKRDDWFVGSIPPSVTCELWNRIEKRPIALTLRLANFPNSSRDIVITLRKSLIFRPRPDFNSIITSGLDFSFHWRQKYTAYSIIASKLFHFFVDPFNNLSYCEVNAVQQNSTDLVSSVGNSSNHKFNVPKPYPPQRQTSSRLRHPSHPFRPRSSHFKQLFPSKMSPNKTKINETHKKKTSLVHQLPFKLCLGSSWYWCWLTLTLTPYTSTAWRIPLTSLHLQTALHLLLRQAISILWSRRVGRRNHAFVVQCLARFLLVFTCFHTKVVFLIISYHIMLLFSKFWLLFCFFFPSSP